MPSWLLLKEVACGVVLPSYISWIRCSGRRLVHSGLLVRFFFARFPYWTSRALPRKIGKRRKSWTRLYYCRMYGEKHSPQILQTFYTPGPPAGSPRCRGRGAPERRILAYAGDASAPLGRWPRLAPPHRGGTQSQIAWLQIRCKRNSYSGEMLANFNLKSRMPTALLKWNSLHWKWTKK